MLGGIGYEIDPELLGTVTFPTWQTWWLRYGIRYDANAACDAVDALDQPQPRLELAVCVDGL